MRFNSLIPELSVTDVEKSKVFYLNLGFEIKYQREKLKLGINKIGLDSGYDTYEIKKYFEDNNIFGIH